MPQVQDLTTQIGEPPAAPNAVTGLLYVPTELDQAAESYVRRGHSVVPVRPHTKSPYAKDWEKHPLRTVEEVQGHWAGHPTDNIGLFMGDEYVALDIDTKGGKQGAQTLAWLAGQYPSIKSTLTQHTQSGGCHKLFKLRPDQQHRLRKRTNAKLGPCKDNSGLDIITGNAIIVVAPSATLNGTYRWEDVGVEITEMPDDLFDLLLGVEPAGRESANDPALQPLSTKPTVVELDDKIVALLKRGFFDGCGYMSPSEARAAAYRALHTAGYTVGHIACVLEKSPLRYHADTTRPPLSGEELRKDIKSVLALPYTGSTGHTGHGCMPGPHCTPGLFVDYPSLCRTTNGRRWIVKGLIPADGTGVIYGETGCYKTFVALDLALHAAHGMERPPESPDTVTHLN